MLNKVLILFSLITGYSVFADTVSQTTSVQNWKLKEITLNSNLGPFPEYIKINFTNENEGTLVIKLRRQDEEKIYPFSKGTPKPIESEPNYNGDDGEYFLHEKAVVSFSENTITVDLEWSTLHQGETVGDIIPGSYEFVLKDKGLDFKRTNGADEDLLVYTAVYFEDAPLSWKLQEVILNPDPFTFPDNIGIEFTNENEGKLVVQFAQHDPKTYPFSRSQLTQADSVEKHTDEYSLKEEAKVSLLENTITLDLKQGWLKSGELMGSMVPLRHEFVIQDDRLDFKAIKGVDEQVFTAIYSLEQ